MTGVQTCALPIYRALKFPRPKKKKEVIDSVKNEIKWLREIRHENIISVYTLGEVKVEENIQGDNSSLYPYFVMDFIEGAKDLWKKIEDKIINEDKLEEITKWIAEKFYGIAKIGRAHV